MTTVYARLQSRRDTAANWTAANPVLAEGEIGFITDTKAAKIGDGVTAWNDLLTRPSQEQLVAIQAAAEQAAADADQRLTATAAAQTATESARDETQTLRDQTYTYKQDVASAIVYQDLASIAASKNLTMVAGCVYDTRLDTDGGAWRDRCQGTSWYQEALNTAIRGARRDFPTVALIITENYKVTIFDGDDPSLPMWATFSAASGGFIRIAPTVAAKNARLVFGAPTVGGALSIIDLVSDRGWSNFADAADVRVWRSVTDTRDSAAFVSDPTIGKIVNRSVLDVAMTVLPNAPVDPETGLQVPTVAAATGGGVSVIKHDGAVVNSSATVGFSKIIADENGFSVGRPDYEDIRFYDGWPATDAFGSSALIYRDTVPSLLAASRNSVYTAKGLAGDAIGNASGVTKLCRNRSSLSSSMVHYLTSTWISGWLPGDIRGAFLASSDQTDLVSSGELVTNGTLDADASGWSASLGGAVSFDAGRNALSCDGDGSSYFYTGNLGLVAGKSYVVSFDLLDAAVVTSFGFGTGSTYSASASTGGSGNRAAGTYKDTLVATQDAGFMITHGGGNPQTFSIDNVSVQLADEDRSVKGNGLIVHGTIPRAPVATGAELVGYGPFSATDYLEQPYNADLDFGAGNFWVNFWCFFNAIPAGTDWIFSRDGAAFAGWINSTNLGLNFNGGNYVTAGLPPVGKWSMISFIRRNGLITKLIDGKQTASDSVAAALNATTKGLWIGNLNSDTTRGLAGKLALFRIGATAPSDAQIAKIYRDELRLFQENAQCTLFGTSDAVTALAHDPVTGLLHAGTSAGRSDFDGLLRVGNTQTPVAKAIAASGGMILEG